MYFKQLTGLAALTMILTAFAFGAVNIHDEKVNNDPISGEWNVSFLVQGSTTPATFDLKLNGNKVTGTANSAHTGPGTVRDGSWSDNKLSFTLDFAKHESIAITGHLEGNKLVGEFTTEGFTAKWEAEKKGATKREPAANQSTRPADGISGNWKGAFTAEGMTVPLTLKLQVEGDKITGTTDSPHMGAGKITNGKLSATGLSFDIEGAVGVINVSGSLKEGKLAGEFSMGPRKGTFEATRE